MLSFEPSKTNEKKREFGDLDPGEVFFLNDFYWMKIDDPKRKKAAVILCPDPDCDSECDSDSEYSRGEVHLLPLEVMVLALNATMTRDFD